MQELIRKTLREHLVLAVALLATLAVYFKFLFFGHISWDDPEMVFKNSYVKHFDVKGFFTDHFVGNYIPVTMLAHAFGWLLFGDGDGGHHLLNIALHLLNGILVYKLGNRLFRNNTIANIGCIIFLLHPLQVESVGWISELKNVLSCTFYLAASLWYLRFYASGNKGHYAVCFLFFILGCLSKSSVVVLPLSLICFEWILAQKIEWKRLANKIPFLVVSVVIGLINIRTQTADLFINHAHEFPYYQRFGFAGFGLLKYLLLFLAPVQLSVIYPYPEVKAPVFVIGYVLLLAIAALLFFLIRKKSSEVPAIILFILANLALVLQLLPFGEVLYADRYLYVPLIGLGWLLGLLLAGIKLKPATAGLILVVFLSVFTFTRGSSWKNAITLYEDIIKKYPDQFIALNSAGVESMFLNEDKKALDYLNRAVAVAPRNYKGFYNRGLLYLKNNKPEQAIKSFNQSLDLYDYGKAYTGRAMAYYMLGDNAKAMNDAQLALRSDKNNAKAHYILANCYNDMNQLDEALKEYNQSIALDPNESDFYFKRAIVAGKKQDFRSCLNDLELCLQLNPAYYEAYYWKGVAKMNLNQSPCQDLRIAARHNIEPAVKALYKYCGN